MALVMTPIYTQTVGAGGAASVTFNNIPQFYTDLKVVISARSSFSTGDAFFMRVGVSNSIDSSAAYSNTRLIANNGTTIASDRYSSKTETFYYASLPGAGSTANTFNNTEIYVPNYTGSNFKQLIMDFVSENNSATAYYELGLMAGLYRGTGAITNLFFSTFNGGSFVQHSTFSLYGIIRSGA